jgi:CheY-like chemotaxis protein
MTKSQQISTGTIYA